MNTRESIRRFEEACAFLPLRLRREALALPDALKERAEELRLRAGFPMTVLLPEGERSISGYSRSEAVGAEEIEQMIAASCEYSRYASAETLRRGYLTLRGGFRLGICGTVVMREDESSGLREFSSAALRILHEHTGVAEGIAAQLFEAGQFRSTLIVSPPGCGKTTLLRDLIRVLSFGAEDRNALRVAVVDERGEIAAAYQGQAQTELGSHTDVLSSCPKRIGIPMVLRTMNPQVIAVDEITEEADIYAIRAAANCGAALLATMHALCREELVRKGLWQELSRAEVFSRMITISCIDGKRQYEVSNLPCCALPAAC